MPRGIPKTAAPKATRGRVSNRDRLIKIKRRVSDFIDTHELTIKRGNFVSVTSHVFVEMMWLIRELEKITGDTVSIDESHLERNPERLEEYERPNYDEDEPEDLRVQRQRRKDRVPEPQQEIPEDLEVAVP